MPTATDGERITLPPSALEALERLGALDPGKPLAFELEALWPDLPKRDTTSSSSSSSKDGPSSPETILTHAGVLEFTAAEGTVGVPPQTALSLTRGRSLGALGNGGVGGGGITLRVQYVQLPQPAKSFVRLQPRGTGFHAPGQDVVNIDLKKVLERELSRHTALTKGDWLAIRHEKETYELVVVNLEPADALCLVHTDLEVDVLPSEAAVAAQAARLKAEAEAKAETARLAEEAMAAAAAQAARAEAAAAARLALPPEPTVSTAGGGEGGGEVPPEAVVAILIRWPSGAQKTRRFVRGTTTLADVFHFAGCCEATAEGLGLDAHGVALTTNYPKRSFTLANDGATSLADAGLTGRREALFLQALGGSGGSGAPATVSADDASRSGDRMEVDENAAAAAAAGAPAEDLGSATAATTMMGQQTSLPSLLTGASAAFDDFKLQPGAGPMDELSQGSEAQGGNGGESSPGREWKAAMLQQRAALDRQLSEEVRDATTLEQAVSSSGDGASAEGGTDGSSSSGSNLDRVALFHSLVAWGVPHERAASGAQHWATQLVELQGMGFLEQHAAAALELLQRYQGRLPRVVNALSERVAASSAVVDAPPGDRGSAGGGRAQPHSSLQQSSSISTGAAPASRQAPAVAPAPAAPAATPVAEPPNSANAQEAFQAKFMELLSLGMAPNEAAAQALHILQSTPTSSSADAGAHIGPQNEAPASTQTLAAPNAEALPSAAPSAVAEATRNRNAEAAGGESGPPAAITSSTATATTSATARWAAQQGELAAMGFRDAARNAELLDRYQGRLERVVNVLAGAD